MDSGENSPQTLINGRDLTFSVMKGIAIVSVVIGHAVTNDSIETFVNQYHLAVFFFVSGYFFKDNHLANIKDFAWRKFKHLYIPYMKYGIVFVALHNLLYSIHLEYSRYDWYDVIHEIRNFTIGMTSEEPLIGAMWFCPALLVVSIISASAIKIASKQKSYVLKTLIIMMIPIVGWILCRLNVKSPRCLWEYMQICGIYCLGYYFKSLNSKCTSFCNNIYKSWGTIVTIFFCVIILNDLGLYANLQPQAIQTENVIVVTMIGGSSAIAIYLISRILNSGNNLVAKGLGLIGDYSFSIMALHLLCFKVVSLLYCLYYREDLHLLVKFPTIEDVGSLWTVLYVLIGVSIPCLLSIVLNKIKYFLLSYKHNLA